MFPTDPQARKAVPVHSGCLMYFPAALAAVAQHSARGNDQHNPGQPLHHDRSKSGDELDALARHLLEGDLVAVAWRALSALQKQLEAQGAPIAPAARNAAGQLREEALARAVAYDARPMNLPSEQDGS